MTPHVVKEILGWPKAIFRLSRLSTASSPVKSRGRVRVA